MPFLNTPKLYMYIIWFFLSSIILPLSFLKFINLDMTLVQWQILSMNSIHLYFSVVLDPMGMIFSSAVLFISANIMHFTMSYMKEDPFIKRFTHLVLLFILSMNLLIFIPHLIILLIGWDGLGVTSFILVIYYQNPKSLAAGMITALTNRVGDALILLSIAWTFNQGHWDILNMWNHPSSLISGVAIFIATLTKSAQIPFSSWLPAAMAAPTPVSALVHSSTLVTAGVFLLLRFYPFLQKFQFFNKSLLIISSMTMFMAGMSALMEMDMKKIIALSTLSQLGVMMASLGLNLPNLAFFHLITHAMFKALLFICAGAMINMFHHAQDLRFMGFLFNQSPLLVSSVVVASLALCGSPFLAGFYSKDMIIEMMMFNPMNTIIFILFFTATAFTSAYSARFFFSILWSPFLSNPLHQINNNDSHISIPTFNLTIMAILGGSSLNWSLMYPLQEPFLSPMFKPLPLLSASLGLLLSMLLFMSSTSTKKNMFLTDQFFNHFCCSMWFMSPLSSQYLMKTPLLFSNLFLSVLDQGWNEMLGGKGLLQLTTSFSSSSIKWQDNIITSHLLLITMIMIPILFF